MRSLIYQISAPMSLITIRALWKKIQKKQRK